MAGMTRRRAIEALDAYEDLRERVRETLQARLGREVFVWRIVRQTGGMRVTARVDGTRLAFFRLDYCELEAPQSQIAAAGGSR